MPPVTLMGRIRAQPPMEPRAVPARSGLDDHCTQSIHNRSSLSQLLRTGMATLKQQIQQLDQRVKGLEQQHQSDQDAAAKVGR
jgi:hypothetical protein